MSAAGSVGLRLGRARSGSRADDPGCTAVSGLLDRAVVIKIDERPRRALLVPGVAAVGADHQTIVRSVEAVDAVADEAEGMEIGFA